MKNNRRMEMELGLCLPHIAPQNMHAFCPLSFAVTWHPDKTWGVTLALFPFVFWFGWVDKLNQPQPNNLKTSRHHNFKPPVFNKVADKLLLLVELVNNVVKSNPEIDFGHDTQIQDDLRKWAAELEKTGTLSNE